MVEAGSYLLIEDFDRLSRMNPWDAINGVSKLQPALTRPKRPKRTLQNEKALPELRPHQIVQ